MTGREEDPRIVYADIIDLPHWDSPVHLRMSPEARAAQFAPYAALVGYGDLVKEEARETGVWTDPGEDEAEELNRNLAEIESLLQQGIRPVCRISYFVPDARKDGGKNVDVTGGVKRIDSVRRKIVLTAKKGLAGAYEEIDLDKVIRVSQADDSH